MNVKIYQTMLGSFHPVLNNKCDFPIGFKLVAEKVVAVDTNYIQEVLSSTFAECQNIDTNWTAEFNGTVIVEDCRSLSVGDVIVIDGFNYRIEDMGFKAI